MTVISPDNDQHLSIRKSEVAMSVASGRRLCGWGSVHNSMWEFDGYIKLAILNRSQWDSVGHLEWDSAGYGVKFCRSLKHVPSLPRVFLLGLGSDLHWSDPSLWTNERTNESNLYWILLLHTSVDRENKNIFFYIYILLVVVCYGVKFCWSLKHVPSLPSVCLLGLRWSEPEILKKKKKREKKTQTDRENKMQVLT